MRFHWKILCLCLAGYTLVNTAVHAQTSAAQTNRNRAAQYYLGSEDELLVPVNVWGFVERPGQYMVPNNTDLISLLSFAGGPKENARISSVRIVRSDTRLGNIVWNINVKKYLNTADEQMIPMLRPGDTVIVKGTTLHWVMRFFSFIGQLAVFAQIFYLVAIGQEYLNK